MATAEYFKAIYETADSYRGTDKREQLRVYLELIARLKAESDEIARALRSSWRRRRPDQPEHASLARVVGFVIDTESDLVAQGAAIARGELREPISGSQRNGLQVAFSRIHLWMKVFYAADRDGDVVEGGDGPAERSLENAEAATPREVEAWGRV